jgi:hypothetical protein
MLLRALRTGSDLCAFVLGGSFFVYMMFSFSASILGILMALITLFAVWQGLVTWTHVVRTAALAGATVLLVIGITFAVTRFNLIACFAAAVHGHHEQQGNGGFDDSSRYLLRSTGNILAYLLSTVPLCILGIAALNERGERAHHRIARATFVALLATILIAGFSGQFYLETERIWIFFTPLLALAAGYEAARRRENDGSNLIFALVLLVLLISCSQNFLFMHYR